jgi:hypothetical protein
MQAYRVLLEGGHRFLIVVSIDHISGCTAELATAVVYRLADGKAQPEPLRRANGSVLEFTGIGEVAALNLACSVLQVLHGRMQSLRLDRCGPPI